MKRISKNTFIIAMAMSITFFVGCSSTPKNEKKEIQVETQAEVDRKANEMKVTNWANRNMDVEPKPEWLRKLLCGNADFFRNEFSIEKNQIIKYSVGTAKTRDASLAASRVNYNAIRAEELRTKVVSEAAATMNDEGYTEAVANAATLAKADISGHQLVTQFWQEVQMTDEKTEETKVEYICYSIYQISKEDWANTLKAFMQQVIPAIPDSTAQVKMAETIQSLYDETTKEIERSEAETKSALAAQIELARIEAAKATGAAESASSSNDGLNWMDALDLACSVLF